jgi:hypothetical protein
MSTLEMMKFWLILEMMPLFIVIAVVLVAIVGCVIVGVYQDLRAKFKKPNASVSISGDKPEYAPGDCSLSDTDRLVWLRRNVSGFEMRRIGICMNDTGDTEEFRKRIDDIIRANSIVFTPCSNTIDIAQNKGEE